MKYGSSSSASATASRQPSGSVRISSSGSFPAGIRMTRTLLTHRSELLEQPALRRRLAGQVDVVGEGDRIGVSVRQLDLALRQRRSEAGHDVLEAGLVGGHHVGVALDDDRQLLAPDGALGKVDPVQGAALVEERPSRASSGTSVPRPRAGSGRPDRSPDRRRRESGMMIRPRNRSIDTAARRRAGEPGTDQLRVGEALAAQALGHRLPGVRRVADREALERLLRQAALGQVGTRALSLAGLEEHLSVPRDGRLERLPQAPLPPILACGALARARRPPSRPVA